jgi:hypothetical protein
MKKRKKSRKHYKVSNSFFVYLDWQFHSFSCRSVYSHLILTKQTTEGKPIPTELRNDIDLLKDELEFDDLVSFFSSSQHKSYSFDRVFVQLAFEVLLTLSKWSCSQKTELYPNFLDDEYARAGTYDPKVMLTTSREPSPKLVQFVKVSHLSLLINYCSLFTSSSKKSLNTKQRVHSSERNVVIHIYTHTYTKHTLNTLKGVEVSYPRRWKTKSRKTYNKWSRWCVPSKRCHRSHSCSRDAVVLTHHTHKHTLSLSSLSLFSTIILARLGIC